MLLPPAGDLTHDFICPGHHNCTRTFVCPFGTVVMSGGVEIVNSSGINASSVQVSQSYPTQRDSWMITVANSSSSAGLFRGHLVCIEAPWILLP